MERDAVLVTGGNSGIGFEGARRLAREGWRVAMASRDRAASAQAVARITGETGNDAVCEMGLDLGSTASVRQLAREIAERGLLLRALVCNAGLQTNVLRLSSDGYERTFAVNHLGHFLLVNLLLERLRAQAPARIVVVASGVHDPRITTGARSRLGSGARLSAGAALHLGSHPTRRRALADAGRAEHQPGRQGR